MAVNDALSESIRGQDAKRIIEHPLYQESISKVRENIVNSIARSGFGEAETHHRLAIALQVLNAIEKSLIDVMETGTMADLQLKDKRKFFG